MKTKLTGLLILFSTAIISCDTDLQQDHNDLLTSTIWKGEQTSLIAGEASKEPECRYTFHKNGDYTLEFGEMMSVTGKWKWVSKNEIFLELKSFTFSGLQENYKKGLNYNVRILEISKSKLKTLKKFETDAWDSGFAREATFKPI
ncbi:MAG TPA: hypothetical protein VFU05_03830 [Cyclobacteriaceae bacterium]|nr:hypothetical protein [Cyclobacteriaceae bacterium]